MLTLKQGDGKIQSLA